MAVSPAPPSISILPPAPLPTDAEAVFDAKAGVRLTAEEVMVTEQNAALAWQAGSMADTKGYKDAAAISAGAAADSATAANASKNAAAAQVGLAADQVALAAGQVVLANAAKADAQAAAIAAGAAAGLPPDRVPFSVLQINAAGAVSWGYGLPDRAAAKVGQSLILGAGKVPIWGYAGQQIGDTLITSRNPGTLYLPADGSIRLQSAYPDLFAQVGLAGGIYGNNFTASPIGITARVTVASPNGTVIALAAGKTYRRSTDKGITWTTLSHTQPVDFGVLLVTDGNGGWMAFPDANNTSNTLLASDDDGITWVAKSMPYNGSSSPYYYAYYVGSGNFIVNYGASNILQRTSNLGTTWSSTALGTTTSSGLSGLGSDKAGVVLALINSTLYKSINFGVSFVAMPILANGLQAIATDGAGTWLILGSNINTNAIKSVDNAVTFSTQTSSQAINVMRDSLIFYDNVFLGIVNTTLVLIEYDKGGNFVGTRSNTNGGTILASAGGGVLIATANGSPNIYRSLPTYSYDTATQFRLPTLQAPVALKSYIKALEAA